MTNITPYCQGNCSLPHERMGFPGAVALVSKSVFCGKSVILLKVKIDVQITQLNCENKWKEC